MKTRSWPTLFLSTITAVAAAAACGGGDDPDPSPSEGAGGASQGDTSCSVATDDNGVVTIECPDGTSATVALPESSEPGQPGAAGSTGGVVEASPDGCTATPEGDGRWTLDCVNGGSLTVTESWSGRFVHLNDNDELVLTTVAGDQVTYEVIDSGIDAFATNLDSSRVVFSDGADLLLLDLSQDDAEPRPFTTNLEDLDFINADTLTFSPDGSSVVVQGGVGTYSDLYVVRIPDSGRADLQPISPGAQDGHWAYAPQFSADGNRLFFLNDPDTDGNHQLYFVDISEGTPAAPVLLNPPFSRDVTTFALVNGGERVVYRGDQDEELVYELYVVSTDDPGNVAKINDTLPTGADVEPLFGVSADGNKVLYVADEETYLTNELFVVDISGATPGRSDKINGPTNASIDRLEIAEQGHFVAYRADQDEAGVREIYLSDISGATPTEAIKLNQDLGDFGDVNSLIFSPDGTQVAFNADPDQENDNERDLYVVDLTGPAPTPPRLVSAPLVNLGSVGTRTFFFVPNSTKIAYSATVFIQGDPHWMLADANVHHGPSLTLNLGTGLSTEMHYVQ